MLNSTAIVDIGGALLVAVLALFVYGVRGAASERRRLLNGFRALVVVLLVSIPIGLTLARVRHG